MDQVKLKVCGITSIGDARSAVDCGAEFLGFNFYRKSPRYISPEAARTIIEQLPSGVITVGIFVNEAQPQDVLEILKVSGVQLAQLHGDEDAAYCLEVGAERVIKALRVGEDFDVRQVLAYPAWAILLDAFDKTLYGGTGKTANWEVAREAAIQNGRADAEDSPDFDDIDEEPATNTPDGGASAEANPQQTDQIHETENSVVFTEALALPTSTQD